MRNIKCNICGNNDITSIYQYKGHIICKNCIHYQRDALLYKPIKNEINISEYSLDYPLSKQQIQCSKKVLQAIKENKDVLLWAVCGAGKTEMVIESIVYILSKGGKVGFLIPRQQVVLQIRDRLSKIFTKAKVIAVCNKSNQGYSGDIIVATTHQAIRYQNYFDLVILDESDAFPYKGNLILKKIVNNTKRGNIIYTTATPGKELLTLVKYKRLECIELNVRYTNKPLAVPKQIYIPGIFNIFILWKLYKSSKRKVLVFLPTINSTKLYYLIFKNIISCSYVTSETDNKEKIVNDFINNKYKMLFTTTILERGVTILDIDVVILNTDNTVFDLASLIQIAGRVGRHKVYYKGDCYFVSNKKCQKIKDCIERINYVNKSLPVVSE